MLRQSQHERITRMLLDAERKLLLAGIERPRWTAVQLLAGWTGRKPVDLYLEGPEVASSAAAGFESDVAARAAGVPLQYLLGTAEFYGREFEVGPGAFIPRPETEVLIETVLEWLRASTGSARPVVIDVGTGTGAIAITLKLEYSDALVTAIEFSASALPFARRNARRHGCRVAFAQGDLLGAVSAASTDLIVSNPPYLDAARAGAWPAELHWEPWLALDGGEKGLASIETLIEQAARVLKPGGILVIEIGEEQAGPLARIAAEHGMKVDRIVKDLTKRDRVAVLEAAWKS